MKMNSAHGSHRSHWHGLSPVRQRKYMMTTRLAASDCPSDYGWNTVVICSLVPIRRMSSRQNVDVKAESLFDTMD